MTGNIANLVSMIPIKTNLVQNAIQAVKTEYNALGAYFAAETPVITRDDVRKNIGCPATDNCFSYMSSLVKHDYKAPETTETKPNTGSAYINNFHNL